MQQKDDAITANVHQVIDALLAEDPIHERLDNAMRYLQVLELYKNEKSVQILNELWDIVHHLIELVRNRAVVQLTPEEDENIAARLLNLYVEISGGALIF